jgi:hypothetical protein
MLDNTVTLPVDILNTDVTTDRIYTRYEEYLNRSVYIGPDHTLSLMDTLSFYRSFPKVSGNFRGMAKTSFKFSDECTVLGVDGISSLTLPKIAEMSFSLPVGVTAADVLELRQRIIALLDSDTIMNKLNNTLMI